MIQTSYSSPMKTVSEDPLKFNRELSKRGLRMNVIEGTTGFEKYFNGSFMDVYEAMKNVVRKRETGPMEITRAALRSGSLAFVRA